MKVIDLLNKIANGEETPEKVKYGGIIYTKAVDYVTKEVIDYLNHNESLFEINDGFEYCFINKYLLDEVEIIEEDKNIRKLDFIEEKTFSKRQNGMTSEDRRLLDSNFKEIGNKINEIINYLEENK